MPATAIWLVIYTTTAVTSQCTHMHSLATDAQLLPCLQNTYASLLSFPLGVKQQVVQKFWHRPIFIHPDHHLAPLHQIPSGHKHTLTSPFWMFTHNTIHTTKTRHPHRP